MIITVTIGSYAEQHVFSPYPHVLQCQNLLDMTSCILVGGQQNSGGACCLCLDSHINEKRLENEKKSAGRIHA
jgi:hypothetical protein